MSTFLCVLLLGSPNSPQEFGSGYLSWGTRGGATLGQGDGARAGFTAGGGGLWGGLGVFALEGQYIIGVNENFDIGLGGRVPLWPFGLSPGAEFRPRLLNKGRFQLAMDIGVFLPMYFAGYYYGPGPAVATFSMGVSAEPGVMMSYFIRDCMEVYFGVIVPVGLELVPSPPVRGNFGIVHRGGFAFNFKKQKVGVYANFDFGPRFFFPYVWFWGAFTAGAQFRFGG